MNNATYWEAMELYGQHLLQNHNNPTLFKTWLDNFRDLETQLMTDTEGERLEGKPQYTDGSQTWGPIRWPWKANTENPEWFDKPRTFSYPDHLVAIGSTGWNWKLKESWWLGYDFDAITGHAAGVGIAEEELLEVGNRLPDYCEMDLSTRGGGRHVYIRFDRANAPKTKTHTEHSAVARAMLAVMSADAGFDFSAKMDVCGGVMWLYHKDANPTNRGFTNLKVATRSLTADDIPINWRDHLEVVSGGRSKVRVRGWTPNGQTAGDELDESTKAYAVVPLDDAHSSVLGLLEGSGYSCNWVNDHHLFQTHTQALKKVHEEGAAEGKPFRGPFDTNSPDTDPGKFNCYMRPRVGGGWDVYRFGQVQEHPLWDDVGGKSHTTFNVLPSLRQGVLAAGGVECADLKAGYQLDTEEALYAALRYLGSSFRLPSEGTHEDRTFSLKSRKGDSRLIVTVSRHKDDADREWPGWEKKPKLWVKLLAESSNTAQEEDRLIAHWDNRVRVVKQVSMIEQGNVTGEFDKWLLNDASGKWVKHPKEHISALIGGEGLAPDLIVQILGNSISNAWTKVNRPFEPEYPGGREWNFDAAQLRYQPAIMKDGETPYHPHWDAVFNHCGDGLTKYIKDLSWCDEWGITQGGDYLKAWVAAMFRHPFCRLPYLFMYSEAQDTGKSTFHESVKMLMTKGTTKADRALTESFNGELANCVLGIIDETDVTRAGRSVYNKLKEWVTGLTISIRPMYRETYEQLSTLHLIQMANNRSCLPVLGGDTRITSMEVPVIKKIIGKDDLLEALRDEGPHFMRTLFNLPLPKIQNRLRVPVIETEDKLRAMEDNRSTLEAFIADYCTYLPGAKTSFKDFYHEFAATLETHEKSEWSKTVVRGDFPDKFPVGKWSGNVVCVGNLALGTDVKMKPGDEEEAGKFVKSGGRILRET